MQQIQTNFHGIFNDKQVHELTFTNNVRKLLLVCSAPCELRLHGVPLINITPDIPTEINFATYFDQLREHEKALFTSDTNSPKHEITTIHRILATINRLPIMTAQNAPCYPIYHAADLRKLTCELIVSGENAEPSTKDIVSTTSSTDPLIKSPMLTSIFAEYSDETFMIACSDGNSTCKFFPKN